MSDLRLTRLIPITASLPSTSPVQCRLLTISLYHDITIWRKRTATSPATAKACALIPTDSLRTVALGLDLWWLLLAAAVIGSLRAVRVRTKRRR